MELHRKCLDEAMHGGFNTCREVYKLDLYWGYLWGKGFPVFYPKVETLDKKLLLLPFIRPIA